MAANFFDNISHTDFLRLVLEAFIREGCEVEPSKSASADAVLRTKSGARIALLCKKYRGAFIGRPVVQQFQEAKELLGCGQGFLVTTTDCLPDAGEFAKGKGIEVFGRDRTLGLLRKAFGDGFLKTGTMPALGARAQAVSAPARRPAGMASYEKVSATRASAPAVPGDVRPAGPARPPAPETAFLPPEQPAAASGPAPVREPELPAEEIEEVASVQSIEVPEPAPEAASAPAPPVNEAAPAAQEEAPPNTVAVVCAECGSENRVPTDQGMVKVACAECGLKWVFLPPGADSYREEAPGGVAPPAAEPAPGPKPAEKERIVEDLRPRRVITCQSCSQQLNVPINRGRLNVRCPKCQASWIFTP